MAFNVSPDGRQYGIEIRDVNTLKTKYFCYFDNPILRVTWRPDSKALIYFVQNEDSTRSLFLWTLESDTHSSIKTQATHNQYEVKWSRDGSLLAFSSDGKELIITDSSSSQITIQGAVRSFSWDKNSECIAVVQDSKEKVSELQLYRAKTGEKIKSVQIGSECDLVSVEWQPFECILLRGHVKDRKKRNITSYLYSIDPQSATVTTRYVVDGEVGNPQWCLDGEAMLWERRSEKGKRVLVLASLDALPLHTFEFDGNISFRGFSYNRENATVLLSSQSKYELTSVSLTKLTDQPVTIAKAKSLPPTDALHEIRRISTPDGRSIKVSISKAKSSLRKNATIIRMLGGEDPQYSANWAERQLYIHHGVDYVTVSDVRPYGVEDLLAVCHYVTDALQVPRRRVVVYGVSTGATVALEAALRDPYAFGVLCVVGLGGSMPKGSPLDKHQPSLRVLGFHGANDRIPSGYAKDILLDSLGDQSLSPPYGFWHVFPGEAHAFLKADAIVHATILAELGVLSCN